MKRIAPTYKVYSKSQPVIINEFNKIKFTIYFHDYYYVDYCI